MLENTETNRTIAAELLEETLDDLYEHAPCGYVSTFPDGAFAKVNQTFLDWIGYRRDELLAGERFQDLLTVPSKIFHETHFAPLLQMQGFVNEIALDLIRRDGQQLPVLVNSVQKRDASGRPVLNRTTIFNASDRRKYEEELRLARKRAEDALYLRDQFLALASHELKTPLAAVLGHIELLLRRVDRENSLNARDRRSLQIISEQTKRLDKMVHSLLDISRIEAGQLSIERSDVDVCALVRRVVDEAQLMRGERIIELQSAMRSAVVQGDELRLEQVFQNLVQNAAKYSPPASPIAVTIRQHDESVWIVVQDRGIGIPQAALPHLFDRFYRAPNAQEGSAGGMGIGLYVVKQIVELHGGRVTVESTEGTGSAFTVVLPLEIDRVQP